MCDTQTKGKLMLANQGADGRDPHSLRQSQPCRSQRSAQTRLLNQETLTRLADLANCHAARPPRPPSKRRSQPLWMPTLKAVEPPVLPACVTVSGKQGMPLRPRGPLSAQAVGTDARSCLSADVLRSHPIRVVFTLCFRSRLVVAGAGQMCRWFA